MPRVRNLFQFICISIAVIIIGIFLGGYATSIFNTQMPLAFSMTFVIWILFTIGLVAAVRWIGAKIVSIYTALLLIGCIIAILTANWTFPTWNYGLTLFWVLAIWSLLTSLLTRNAKMIYIALHLVNVFLILGWYFFILMDPYRFPTPLAFFLLPAAFFFILLGAYQPIITLLTSLPITKNQATSYNPRPKYETPNYNEGYRPTASYKEGGRIHTYQPEAPEQAQTQYPQQTQ